MEVCFEVDNISLGARTELNAQDIYILDVK